MAKRKNTKQLREDMIAHRGYDPTNMANMNRAERRAAMFALRNKKKRK